MTRHDILVDALRLLPGIGERNLMQIIDACIAALPDVTLEEAVAAASQVEREQQRPSGIPQGSP